jgi:hypothetical protein
MSIVAYNWYIIQRSHGRVYLYYTPGPELVAQPPIEVLLASYSVDRNMTLHMYAGVEGALVDYVLIKEHHHQARRQRTYDFAVEFAAWNMRRNEAAYA